MRGRPPSEILEISDFDSERNGNNLVTATQGSARDGGQDKVAELERPAPRLENRGLKVVPGVVEARDQLAPDPKARRDHASFLCSAIPGQDFAADEGRSPKSSMCSPARLYRGTDHPSVPALPRSEPVGDVGSYESFSLPRTPVSLPRVENTYLASETHLDGTSVRAVAREVSEPRNAPRSAYGVEPPSRTDFPENSDESPTRPIPKYRVAYDRGASITAIGQGSNTVLQGIGILVG